jgi:hypothetical protein
MRKWEPSSGRSATEGATRYTGCSTFQPAEIARQIMESAKAQAFSYAVAFRVNASLATALSRQNLYQRLVS